jgi:hypothetical protein
MNVELVKNLISFTKTEGYLTLPQKKNLLLTEMNLHQILSHPLRPVLILSPMSVK